MDLGNILAFVVFPYITLTIFTVGHVSRYLTDRYKWNSKSSEFLEKKQLFFGSNNLSLGYYSDFSRPLRRASGPPEFFRHGGHQRRKRIQQSPMPVA